MESEIDFAFNSTLNASMNWFNGTAEWPMNPLRIPYVILAIIGFATNFLMILATLTTKELQTTPNYFILSLSFVDGIYATCFHSFNAHSMMIADWIFGNIWCKVVAVATWYSEGVDFWNIVMFTLNRCFAIVWPIHYHTGVLSSKKVVAVMICAQFIIPLITCIPLFTKIEQDSIVGFVKLWGICSAVPTPDAQLIWDFSNTANIFIPLALIVIFYILIIKSIRANNRRLYSTDEQNSNDARRFRKEVKLTKMASVTIGYYIIFYIPLLIMRLNTINNALPRWILQTITFFHRLGWFSNSILYGILNKTYRNAFKRIICFWRHRNQVSIGDGQLDGELQ